MSRPKTVYLQAVNVRIHERSSADAYVAAFEQVRDKRITKKFRGDRAAQLDRGLARRLPRAESVASSPPRRARALSAPAHTGATEGRSRAPPVALVPGRRPTQSRARP